MEILGIPPRRIFSEKISGEDTKRPRLHTLMNIVQKGDVVVVESIKNISTRPIPRGGLA